MQIQTWLMVKGSLTPQYLGEPGKPQGAGLCHVVFVRSFLSWEWNDRNSWNEAHIESTEETVSRLFLLFKVSCGHYNMIVRYLKWRCSVLLAHDVYRLCKGHVFSDSKPLFDTQTLCFGTWIWDQWNAYTVEEITHLAVYTACFC